MSYCVNCGVELDGSLQACPLCNTQVINPKGVYVVGNDYRGMYFVMGDFISDYYL